MYLMYADESGDCGMPGDGSPSRLFCLSGLVVHELRWCDTVAELIRFRHWVKQKYGVYLDAEIHAAAMISKPGNVDPSLGKLRKHERLAIIRHFADKIKTLTDVSIINVIVDKRGKVPDKDEVFRWAWYSLFQRFENTIRYGNFPGQFPRTRSHLPRQHGRRKAKAVPQRHAAKQPAENPATTRRVCLQG